VVGVCRICFYGLVLHLEKFHGIILMGNFSNFTIQFGIVAQLLDLDSKSLLHFSISKQL